MPVDRRLAGRIVVTAALLLFAICAGWNGLVSRSHPDAARSSLQDGRPGAAQSHAAQAVIRDPLRLGNVSMLGLAHYLNGNEEGGKAAFAIARRMGWRDILALSHAAERALEQDDFVAAALGFDALMRIDPADRVAAALASRLEAVPAGQAALVERIDRGAPWAGAYLGQTDTSSSQTVLRTNTIALATSSSLGCETTFGLAKRLIDVAEHELARAVRRKHCAPAESTWRDVGFASLNHAEVDDPFKWQRIASGDVRIEVQPHGSIEAVNSGSTTLPILRKPRRTCAGCGHRAS